MPKIAFLHAGLWPWFLALGIPIALHLLTRRARITILLPTFVFLKRSRAGQSRLYRVRRPLLLLLRLAALLFLILAFLKPISRGPLATSGANHRLRVIVLDTSLSMGHTRAGVSSLARVRGPVVQMLEDLKTGDRANVLFADAHPHGVLRSPGDDYATLVQAVKDAEPTRERANLTSALEAASAQLANSHSSHKELVIASNFQASNWKDVSLDRLPSDVRVVFLDTADGPRENAGITGVQTDPPAPRPGENTTLVAEVWNGSSFARTLPVQWTIRAESEGAPTLTGNLPASKTAVLVPPYSSATVGLPWTFPAIGRYLISARLPADALPADDVRFMAVDVKRAARVLLLTEDSLYDASMGAYFLYRALQPDPASPGGMEVFVRKPDDISPVDLSTADAVVWIGVKHIARHRIEALRDYISRGGALIVFLSGAASVRQMRDFAALAPEDSGLPFLPRSPLDLKTRRKNYLTLAEVRYESPLLKLFKDPTVADLGSIHFTHVLQPGQLDPGAESLMRYDNGMLAAAQRRLGAGNVLLCNFSPALEASDLARQAIFPPLMHEFVKGIRATSPGQRESHPGDSITIRSAVGDSATPVRALGPDGNAEALVGVPDGAVVLERAGTVGFHRFLKGGKVIDIVAVNPHPAESDLRALDPATLQLKRSNRPALMINSGPGSGEKVVGLAHGRPLWPYCLLVVMLLLLLEQSVAATGRRTV